MNENLGHISPQCFGSFVGAAQERPAISGGNGFRGAQ